MVGVSCIVPAYNEGARIEAVLAALDHPMIEQIIVVDDGSTDDTNHRAHAAARRNSKVRVIALPENCGKSKAVCAGVRASSGSFLMFVDADLIGLTRENLADLIMPVASGEADVSISLRGNALLPWKWIGLDYVSGERVLKRELILSHLDRIERLPAFGIEVYLNNLFIQTGSRIKVVRWDNVISPLKHRKHGMRKGLAAEMRMLNNIVETISIAGTPMQIRSMIRARV